MRARKMFLPAVLGLLSAPSLSLAQLLFSDGFETLPLPGAMTFSSSWESMTGDSQIAQQDGGLWDNWVCANPDNDPPGQSKLNVVVRGGQNGVPNAVDGDNVFQMVPDGERCGYPQRNVALDLTKRYHAFDITIYLNSDYTIGHSNGHHGHPFQTPPSTLVVFGRPIGWTDNIETTGAPDGLGRVQYGFYSAVTPSAPTAQCDQYSNGPTNQRWGTSSPGPALISPDEWWRLEMIVDTFTPGALNVAPGTAVPAVIKIKYSQLDANGVPTGLEYDEGDLPDQFTPGTPTSNAVTMEQFQSPPLNGCYSYLGGQAAFTVGVMGQQGTISNPTEIPWAWVDRFQTCSSDSEQFISVGGCPLYSVTRAVSGTGDI